MTPSTKTTSILALLIGASLVGTAQRAEAQNADIGGQVEALRLSVLDSKEKLKTYEWIETTTVSQKGRAEGSFPEPRLLRRGRGHSEGAYFRGETGRANEGPRQ